MTRLTERRAWLAALVSALLIITSSWAAVAQAAMIGTEQVVQEATADAERERIQAMLQRQDVRDKLTELGVAPDRVEARVAALSDAEVKALSKRMAEMPAGEGPIETVLVLGVFVFLVLLVTDILGFTDVFPFVTSQVDLPNRTSD
ncbi:PA2779 family protein [Ectothiorhodospiraceae bacterium WFHF3C12]|nr:PA2779 family protein [Ectothiorhodospiraceae bacterium WFHF3C12]